MMGFLSIFLSTNPKKGALKMKGQRGLWLCLMGLCHSGACLATPPVWLDL